MRQGVAVGHSGKDQEEAQCGSSQNTGIQKVVMGPRNLQKTVKIRKFGGFWTVFQ